MTDDTTLLCERRPDRVYATSSAYFADGSQAVWPANCVTLGAAIARAALASFDAS